MVNKRLKFHYQPDGSWQLSEAEYCGTIAITGYVYTTNRVEYVNCIKCLEKMTRPSYQTKPKF